MLISSSTHSRIAISSASRIHHKAQIVIMGAYGFSSRVSTCRRTLADGFGVKTIPHLRALGVGWYGWQGRIRTFDRPVNSREQLPLCYSPILVPTRGIEPRVIRLQGGCIASNAWRALWSACRDLNPLPWLMRPEHQPSMLQSSVRCNCYSAGQLQGTILHSRRLDYRVRQKVFPIS